MKTLYISDPDGTLLRSDQRISSFTADTINRLVGEGMYFSYATARAARRLKEYLACDRIIAFGDGKNDVDLFEMADERYAVGNAVDELKVIATGIIGRNDEDGVAKWLEANYRE